MTLYQHQFDDFGEFVTFCSTYNICGNPGFLWIELQGEGKIEVTIK